MNDIPSRNDSAYWFSNVPVDAILKFSVAQSASRSGDSVVRDAFSLLESRIRSATGLPSHVYGIDLVNKAFLPNTGILHPVSDIGGEQAGFHELFRGAFRLYQTPTYRNTARLDERSTRFVLHLINQLLHLVDRAAMSLVDLNRFLGHHEGLVRHRRDFRLDIDDDGFLESVVLVDVGPTVSSTAGSVPGQLVTVIIDDDSGSLTRVAAEKIESSTMDPAWGCKTQRITGGPRVDIVTSWGAGETGGQYFVLRWTGSKYVCVQREPTSGTSTWPLGSMAFYTHHLYQRVQFLDVDGDGLDEIIEWDTLFEESDTFVNAGFANELQFTGGLATVCRVWKWNSSQQVLVEDDLVAL